MFNIFQGAHIHCISQDMLGYAGVIKSSKISKLNITRTLVYTLWPSDGGESILQYGDLVAQVIRVKIYLSLSVHKYHYNEKNVWQTNQGLF